MAPSEQMLNFFSVNYFPPRKMIKPLRCARRKDKRTRFRKIVREWNWKLVLRKTADDDWLCI